MKVNMLKNTLLIFLASAIAFLFVPLFMIGHSPEDYKFLDLEVVYKASIFFTVIVGTIFSLINAILEVFKLNKISTFLIYFVLTWIIFSGFIFSVSSSTEMVDPYYNPIDFINVIIVFVFSGLFAVMSTTSFKKYIQIFLSIIVVTSIIPAILSIYSSDSIKVNTDNHSSIDANNYSSLQLSNKKNIFVISFDGLPGETVSDIIKNNKQYSSELKDFTIFKNAVSQAPATGVSLLGDIYGIQDYKSKGSTLKDVRTTLRKEELSSKLTSNYIPDSFQYRYSGYGMPNMEITSPAVSEFKKYNSVEFFRYPIIRIWSSYGLRLFNVKRYAFYWAKYISFAQSKHDILNKLREYKGPGWADTNVLELNLFDSFTSNISTTDKNISLRYLHFTFTHHPIFLDENCNYRANNKEWFDNNQNEKGIRSNSICGIRKFINFINKLKELNIYDNSLIVFKSDHGQPTNYYSEYPYNLMINENEIFGYSRHRPTLVIKGFKSTYSAPIFRSELVLLNDIAKTICEESKVGSGCQRFNGVNLLKNKLENDEPYFIYVVKDAKAGSSFTSQVSVKIPSRKESLLQAIKESSLVSIKEYKKN